MTHKTYTITVAGYRRSLKGLISLVTQTHLAGHPNSSRLGSHLPTLKLVSWLHARWHGISLTVTQQSTTRTSWRLTSTYLLMLYQQHQALAQDKTELHTTWRQLNAYLAKQGVWHRELCEQFTQRTLWKLAKSEMLLEFLFNRGLLPFLKSHLTGDSGLSHCPADWPFRSVHISVIRRMRLRFRDSWSSNAIR